MSTITVTPDKDALVSEIEIYAPPERVFQALTRQDELMQWWNSERCRAELWEMDARQGGRWRYKSGRHELPLNGVNEFACEGEILEIDPPYLLVYSWIANWHNDKAFRTVVRWELSPTQAGTLVKVTHSGLALENTAREDYRGGWPGVVERLKNFSEKGVASS